jgi:hypothetical protein
MLELTPEEEAAVIMYIVNYDQCNEKCWNSIADIIRKYDQRYTGIVYRGQDSPLIKKIRPFFSTTPLRKMAQLFAPVNWDAPGTPSLCCLHTIHLKNAPVLSTRSIKYTLSNEVRELVEAYQPKKPWSSVEKLIQVLVFENREYNGEELIVLNGGRFFANASLTKPGFKHIDATHRESWYSFGHRRRTLKRTRKA